jgi:uncharacterized repeat protein (TIGR01451 family)
LGGTDTFVTDPVSGGYQFLFVGNPPSGDYTITVTPPPGYGSPTALLGGVALPQGTFPVPAGVTNVQSQATPPAIGVNALPGTLYYLSFNFDFVGRPGEVFNNHIPLDPLRSDPAVDVNPIPSGAVGATVTTTVTLSNNGGTTVTFTPVVVVNGATTTLAAVTLAPGQTVSTAPLSVPLTVSGATVTALVTNPSVTDSDLSNNTDTEVVSGSAVVLLVNKVGDKTVAEVGDSLKYTIRVTNASSVEAVNVDVRDWLPAGFRLIPGTVRGSATVADATGRPLVFQIARVPANNGFVEFSYFVRLGVGSQQGDGINRAQAASGTAVSNTAAFKVTVQGGVFAPEGCIVGTVYSDCDANHVKNNASGSRELGIPGVRLLMLDGSYVITDSEGKYSVCGVKPQTHVIKIDRKTLPLGSRMLPSSNRNAGDGSSLFVDMKGGEMARADFVEGSCSVEVLDQIKARRAQGGVPGPETEKGPEHKIRPGGESSQQQIMPANRQDGASSTGRAAQ